MSKPSASLRPAFAAAAAVSMLAPLTADAQLAAGLDTPMVLTHAPGDPGRVYIAERAGSIRVLDLATRTLDPTPFLDLPTGLVNTAGEGGLLGLAFDPDFDSNGRFYVNLTTGDASPNEPQRTFRNEIRRYQVGAGGTVDAGSFEILLSYDQPQNNHNGGWIGFNPAATGAPGGARHHLFIATGDGGGGNDDDAGHHPTLGNGQDVNTLLGKILRIDVAGASGYTVPSTNPFAGGVEGRDEIFAHGLRNPFRAGFDRLTGELYIGDVGQNTREEVNRLDPAITDPVTGRAPIRNFGWRLREGNIETPTSDVGGPEPENYVPPIYDYRRLGTPGFPDELEGETVIGGYVYRGPVQELQGLYIFGDYISGSVWSLDPDDPFNTIERINDLIDPLGALGVLSSFGEDAAGNLYLLDFGGGEVFIIPEPSGALLALAPAVTLLRRRTRC